MGTIKKGRWLLCCAILAVVISFSPIHVLAATNACQHHYTTAPDCFRRTLYKQEGHYNEYGTLYKCGNCGHTYWENLRQNKFGDHDYAKEMFIGYDTNGNEVWRYRCTYPECRWAAEK